MFLKNRNIISKIKRSKVTDYAALINPHNPFRVGELSCLRTVDSGNFRAVSENYERDIQVYFLTINNDIKTAQNKAAVKP